ncbi:MAG: hypothetical protein WCF18_21240, partial [Chthoniobacteraceae bacterium]
MADQACVRRYLDRRCVLAFVTLTVLARAFADAGEGRPGIESWSVFSQAEVAALPANGLALKSNASMNLPRGLSAQAIYIVDAKPESAVRILKGLDPTRFPELEVFQQRTFTAEGEARFGELKIDPGVAPFQRLLGEMMAPKNLQMSNEERARLPRQKNVAAAQEFWAQVLRERWTRFAREGQLAPAGGFDARGELRALLHEEAKVSGHFAALLPFWMGVGGKTDVPATSHYWDVSSTEGIANFELGAIFERTENERWQVADVTYYSSSGYIAAMSLFEFLPLTGGPRAQTLVWHG